MDKLDESSPIEPLHRLESYIRLTRNPIVVANNMSIPKIYGYRRKTRKHVQNRVYTTRLATHNTSTTEEIMEVVRMHVHPLSYEQLPKQIITSKSFSLSELSDRVDTPKSRYFQMTESPKRHRMQSVKEKVEIDLQTNHIVLKKLNRISPLHHESETSHKVIRKYTTNLILPPINSEHELIPT
jgi:hypothetical protein